MKIKNSSLIAGMLLAHLAFAIPSPTAVRDQKPRWLLSTFLNMAKKEPERLLKIADKLFSDDRIRMVSVEPRLAFEWQHRLAMVTALSSFFDPALQKSVAVNAKIKDQSRKMILKTMENDPSLLVRDGAVESIRRIFRMQPGESRIWHSSLERAFLDPKNFIQGEGLFIRETILTAMHEGALKPSAELRKIALRDKNTQVRELLKAWRTQAYDN